MTKLCNRYPEGIVCLLASHSLQTAYKNLNHRVNKIKFELSRDVETNSGPVDGSKTIKAPYSQDNVTLFGLNAGSQCVATCMSLTALIYNHRNTIVSSRDLQNVMNIGNELYTSLSRLYNSPKIFVIINATQLRFLKRLVSI